MVNSLLAPVGHGFLLELSGNLLERVWHHSGFHGDVDLETQITLDLQQTPSLSTPQIYDFHEFAEGRVNKIKWQGEISPGYQTPKREIRAALIIKICTDLIVKRSFNQMLPK